LIILIHNGVGVLEEIREHFPSEWRIISGVTSLGAYLKQPFSVNAFLDAELFLGATVGDFSEKEITTITQVFSASGLKCTWTDSIMMLIWEKFAINCSINLLTALCSCQNGQLMQYERLLRALIQELVVVLKVCEVPFDHEALVRKVYHTLRLTAGNYSSMHQDIKNNKKTEIAYLNQKLVSIAEKNNTPVPITRNLLSMFYERHPEHLTW
jgi:2-dehydropantoate 2-reductase